MLTHAVQQRFCHSSFDSLSAAEVCCLQYSRLLVVAVASTIAIGCSAPWVSPFSRQPASPATTATTEPAATPLENEFGSGGQPLGANAVLPGVAPAAPDLSSIFDKLLQIREIDPAAEQKLLEQLRETPPDSWALVAEQFRASLAYREQLAAARQQPANSAAVATAASKQTSANVSTNSELRLPASGHDIGGAAEANRPSAETNAISGLAPKRGVEPSASNDRPAPEVASQYADPADQSADPLAGELDSSQPVVQARFDASGQSGDDQNSSQHREEHTPSVETTPPGPLDWRELVDRATAELSRRAPASPRSTAEVHQHATLRILYLLSGETEKAVAPIPHISPTEQDYWSRQLFALATYLDHHTQPDDQHRAAASVLQLDQAVASLRELSALSLRNLTFCKNVYGYGSIEPYNQDVFSPGQQISMYVEVENYRSVSTEKGYRTALASTYEILAEDGSRVGGGEMPEVEDFCRSRRRDFHIQYGLSLPQTIAPGRYRLQLVIKDRQSDKIGHATSPFEIRGGVLP